MVCLSAWMRHYFMYNSCITCMKLLIYSCSVHWLDSSCKCVFVWAESVPFESWLCVRIPTGCLKLSWCYLIFCSSGKHPVLLLEFWETVMWPQCFKNLTQSQCAVFVEIKSWKGRKWARLTGCFHSGLCICTAAVYNMHNMPVCRPHVFFNHWSKTRFCGRTPAVSQMIAREDEPVHCAVFSMGCSYYCVCVFIQHARLCDTESHIHNPWSHSR